MLKNNDSTVITIPTIIAIIMWYSLFAISFSPIMLHDDVIRPHCSYVHSK